jgi:pimeloyl-ACP methyl ester carboxylesterase
MGGRIALSYANANPEKIASLTLLSTFTGSPQPNRFELDQIWAKKMVHSFDDFLKEWYDQTLFAGYTPDLTMRKKHNPTNLSKALLHFSSAKLHPERSSNALFIVGEKDQKYRALYPDSIVVPNAGHMVHLEQPEFIAQIIKKRVYGLDSKR